MKLKNGVDIVSLEKKQARVRMQVPCASARISASEKLAERVLGSRAASLWGSQNHNSNDNFTFETVTDVLPRDEDYIYVQFRALSQRIVEGQWLDFTTPGVLEEAVALLRGATIYPNHEFWNIEKWLGSVSQTAWDAAGANSGGIPGVNAEYKIDALMNPRIARGLMMRPPAIHSTSLTVLFEFEYSHEDLAKEYKFWSLLGEEVDGHIVRLIVTKIREIWEASLVFQGADRLAKHQGDEEAADDFESLEAAGEDLPTNSKDEVKTMKLTKEQKTELGIEFDGEDVPETELLKAATALAGKVKPFADVDLANLQERAAAGDGYIEQQRTEVTRLAKLAELGAEDGDLDPVVTGTIADANFDKLTGLKAYYEKKAGERFPNGRQSLEDSGAIENAGGLKTETKALPLVSVH